MMKTKSILFAVLLLSTAAYAEGELKNFTPGNYKLTSGPLKDCGDGEFAVRDGGTNLGLGYLQGFDLSNTGRSLPGDAPGDEGCIYEARNAMDVQEKKTILTFSEIRKCKDVTKHTLTKVAEIEEGKVKLEAKQTGSPTFHYSCRWTLKK